MVEESDRALGLLVGERLDICQVGGVIDDNVYVFPAGGSAKQTSRVSLDTGVRALPGNINSLLLKRQPQRSSSCRSAVARFLADVRGLRDAITHRPIVSVSVLAEVHRGCNISLWP